MVVAAGFGAALTGSACGSLEAGFGTEIESPGRRVWIEAAESDGGSELATGLGVAADGAGLPVWAAKSLSCSFFADDIVSDDELAGGVRVVDGKVKKTGCQTNFNWDWQ